MTAKKAKELGFTNYAILYGFKGYMRFDGYDGSEFELKHSIWTPFLTVMIWIECIFVINEEGFPVHVGEKL